MAAVVVIVRCPSSSIAVLALAFIAAAYCCSSSQAMATAPVVVATLRNVASPDGAPGGGASAPKGTDNPSLGVTTLALIDVVLIDSDGNRTKEASRRKEIRGVFTPIGTVSEAGGFLRQVSQRNV